MTGGAGCEEKWTAQHTAWDRCPCDLTDSPLARADAPPGLVSIAQCSWPDGYSVTGDGHFVKSTVSNFNSVCIG
jgi:hypothetical protein